MSDAAEFEIVHWVDAPVAEVWAYFTDAEKMIEWQGVEARLDPKPGGVWWVRHENGAVLAGEFLAVDPPHALAFTWGFESPDAAGSGATPAGGSRVDVRLAEEGARTRIELRHSRYADGDPVAHGWGFFLAELARVA